MDKMADTGRKLKVFAGIVAVVLLVGFFLVHHMKSADERNLERATTASASEPLIVNVIMVQKAPSSFSLTLPGETAAWYESVIYARVDGYVARWNADIGDHVKKGQILATIDTPDLDAQLAAAQAKVKASQAVVVARQADAEFAKTTYERWKDSPRGVVSEQEREAKKAGHDSAVAHVNEAQAQTGLDQAHVDRYKALTQFKQVTAPYEGTITERRIDIGNLVTAGSNASNTSLYRMVQDDPIRVFVDVPQSAAGDIKVDTPVLIIAGNVSERVFDGKVTRTAGAISPQTRTLRVEIDIPNPGHALAPGMYVNVIFEVPTKGLAQIPAAALIFRTDGPQVAIVDKRNKVNFQKVTIARDNGNTVEISSGVSSGDRVILNAGSQIYEGQIVEANELKDDSPNAPAQKQ
ncbi:MAG: efflux RND transporter periplasmic adaptor subunit [Syntrophobacteraceae bacterium]|jgi:RND family efflux transporter MFP subunit